MYIGVCRCFWVRDSVREGLVLVLPDRFVLLRDSEEIDLFSLRPFGLFGVEVVVLENYPWRLWLVPVFLSSLGGFRGVGPCAFADVRELAVPEPRA